MRLHWPLALLVAIAVTGCASTGDNRSTAPTTAESEAALRVKVMLPSATELPDDAILVLRVIPADSLEDPQAAIGAKRIELSAGSRMNFELPYQADRYRPDSTYHLQGAVHSGSRLLLYNGDGEPVRLESEAPVTLELDEP